MSFARLTESVSPQTAHAVGIGSGVSGLALWSEIAKHLTIIAGLVAVVLTILGGLFYAGYWGLKMWAKFKRVRDGDFKD